MSWRSYATWRGSSPERAHRGPGHRTRGPFFKPGAALSAISSRPARSKRGQEVSPGLARTALRAFAVTQVVPEFPHVADDGVQQIVTSRLRLFKATEVCSQDWNIDRRKSSRRIPGGHLGSVRIARACSIETLNQPPTTFSGDDVGRKTTVP